MRKYVGALVVALGVVSGCIGISGSGPVGSEVRSVGAFTRIDAGFGARLEVQIGPTQDVQVRAQSNILPLITTIVDGGTLRIALTSAVASATEMTVAIVVPKLDGITLSGGSNATVTGLADTDLEVTLAGGAVVTATGAAATVNVTASGGSRAQLRGLSVATMVVDASGGSVIEAEVSSDVGGRASGGSRVSVSGDAVLNVQASDGAKVERID